MDEKWKIIYYETEDNRSEIYDFIEKQKENNQIKILNWLEKLEELGLNLPRPYADYLEDGIYELRIKLSGNRIRILYSFVSRNLLSFLINLEKTRIKFL